MTYKRILNDTIGMIKYKALLTDSTKAEYIFYCPEKAMYTNEILEKFLVILESFTGAKYCDIIVCEVKEGCIHVTLMIKEELIPTLRSLFSPENCRETCQQMPNSLQHPIIKVLIRGDVVYKSGTFEVNINFLMLMCLS